MTAVDTARMLANQFAQGSPDDMAKLSPVGWKVSRQKLADQILERINPGSSLRKSHIQTWPYPQQARTSRCGPAAFLYCLLVDRPDIYVQFAISLWQTGNFTLSNGPGSNALVVTPGKGTIGQLQTAVSSYGMNELDWMTMGSLDYPDRGNADPADSLSAITLPRQIRRWFASVGSFPWRMILVK